LVIPFIKEGKESAKIAFWFLLVLSLISMIFLVLLFMDCVLPLMDPEFIMSSLWNLNTPNWILDMVSKLFLLFGLPGVGILSILIILEYSRGSPVAEGDS